MILETPHIQLRTFEINDVDEFALICADSEVMRYIGSGPHDKAMTEVKIKQWIENYKVDGFGLLALVFKETNQLIGFCGLIGQSVDGTDYIELGYRLARDFWGRGLATEVAYAVRDHAFMTLHLPELVSIIHHENEASKNVARKIGMTLFKKTVFQNIDVEIFRIRNQEKQV